MKKGVDISLYYNSKKIKVQNVKKVREFEKITGLMFHRREKCPAMLFEFIHPTNMRIHSLFVFFPFLAVWLDDKNTIVDLKKIKPFELSAKSNKQFYKLLEIPINKKYSNQIKTILKKFNNR
ncbi:MAG TPA: DUF192 domain-containing protein [Candidatus Pacearchaeota archaeon]|nr:DUF192 domain-containing protein [Candidatus Pacearchaeota archaeon]